MLIKKVVSLCFVFALTSFSLAQAATITGTVKYDGEAPSFKPIKMDADPICATKHTAPAMPQTLVLGEGNTMAWVFVQVKSGLPKQQFSAPAEAVVLDQQGCEYHPHVVGVMTGQTLKILNPDGTLHNVHALSKVNGEFNMAMPKFRTETTKVFDKPEFAIPFKCDVHPWMGAYVSVVPHPFFAVTVEDGKYSIPNLPAGTYEIEAWHEKLGTKTQSITVADADTATADFTFAKPQK